MLHAFRVAPCFAEWRHTCITAPITKDFVYVRRHSGRCGGNYLSRELDRDVKVFERG
jgi:hypothetical protein